MVRDITTTYNVWNIDERNIKKLQMPYQDKIKNFLRNTEITAPKAQLGLSKKFIIRYDYSIMAAANVNMRFTKTNDLLSIL
jgi:predicted HicB family RNase H-like nuclease